MLYDYSLQLWFVSPNTSTDCVAVASSNAPRWPCQWHFLYWLWNTMATLNLLTLAVWQRPTEILEYLQQTKTSNKATSTNKRDRNLYSHWNINRLCSERLQDNPIHIVGVFLKCLQLMEYISILFKICLAISMATSSSD